MMREAVLHTPLSKDAYVLEGNKLVLRIRTGKNDMASCTVWYGDRVCMHEPIDVTECAMEKVAFDEFFDYYEARIDSEFSRVCYYFQLTDLEGETQFYSEYGFSGEMTCHRTQYFQFPYLHKNDVIRVPEWTKDMVMYHIFPDSFASGERVITKAGREVLLANGFTSKSNQGGTLAGVLENLDYIQSLHVNCIYLNPIFRSASYHKYDTIDYYEIDPLLGTKEDLHALVDACHERGIRVILDGVFNHCGNGFFAFQDVLAKGEKSDYCDWFYKLKFPIDTSVPPNYEAFAYVPEMPKLDTSNQKVRDYFCQVGSYWIREFNIDGWRLDVANEIDHDFWRAFRRTVKSEKPDAFMIGEIWEDSGAWLLGDQFDSTMNYTFSYICREFFAERRIGATQFAEKINHMNMRYPESVNLMQMNFLDTHDVPRFLSYCKGDTRRLKLALFFMMTAQGIPSVFYGDELEIQGVTEPEYRSPMPWEKVEGSEAAGAVTEEYLLEGSEAAGSCLGAYRDMIRIRRRHSALQTGNFRIISCNDEANVLVFSRENEEERVYVVINNSDADYGNVACMDVAFEDVVDHEAVVLGSVSAMSGKIMVMKKKRQEE